MCFDYEDTADVYNESTVKTRKKHYCDGCHKVHPAGSQMLYVSGLFDGDWFRYYVCEPCQMLRYSIAAEEIRHGCEWHTAWCAFEDLQEYCNDRSEPVQMLTGTPEESYREVCRLHRELTEAKRKALWETKREVVR